MYTPIQASNSSPLTYISVVTARSTEDGGLTVGEIVAIVFAVLVATAAIVLVILFCLRKKCE